ncbi:hypothetical protein ONZ51_g5062 [Trametes cubensis]|uniref:BTB domain-containing protein n=1 Tax=Trametes cubensis TaxID=1111947 RepID=A0AAD7TUQ9_9APHY|nr:hypothetical protein ONZ51_g5062 [Trametes cubensis]
MSHLPPSADTTANSGLTTTDGLISVERGAKLDMEDETRQGPARPDAGGTDVDGARLDGSRHVAASGARAKTASLMDIDESGLARMAQAEDAPVPDAEYYIESADCTIRVEDTLFRVHRYFLGRDNSAFQHMFSMPVRDASVSDAEGVSDDNPICLYGESAEHFRALLSVFYDLPSQLHTYNTSAANINRLLTICEMTNKYSFASTESWAIDTVYNVLSGLYGPPQRQYDLATCSSAWIRRLLEVAILCGHKRLIEYVSSRWADRIMARDLRPIHALEIAARGGSSKLAGIAHYVQLLEMGADFDAGVVEDGPQYGRSQAHGHPTTAADGGPAAAPSGQPNTGTPAVLTREQKRRLLSGHWSLTRLWERLAATPPKFERPDGCTYHQRGCVSTWAEVWREVARSERTLSYPVVDVIHRLAEMKLQLVLHEDLSTALSPQCMRAALLAVRSTITEVTEGLGSHFSDLVADDGSAPG